jgi:hypothetical protein
VSSDVLRKLDQKKELDKEKKKKKKRKKKSTTIKKSGEMPPATRPATLLDLYVVEKLKKFGHPDKVLIDLVEKNIAMMNLIEEEMLNMKQSTQDEDGNFNGPFAGDLAALYLRYSTEVRAGLKDLSSIWETIGTKEVDTNLVDAYKNVTIFIEFLKGTNSAMIPEFMKWKREYNTEGEIIDEKGV